MSLGANGIPDKLIKEGLKQPNQIKVSFEKGAKEITGHVTPNQAQFGAEYFLVYTLPDFKSKILTRLSDFQKDNGPLLFSLLGQCFQDVGLTEWTSIIAKQCPDNADCTKANFDKCIRDYLEAIARFPNIGDQLICWLRTAKKPTLMPMHKFMRHQVQLLSYLESDYPNATVMIDNPTIVIKTIDTTIALEVTTRTQKAPGPTTRRMIASAITPRKRATRPCIMTSPLSQVLAICSEKEVVLVQDLLCALNLGLALAQAAGATTTIMLTKMTVGQIRPLSVGTCTPQRVMMGDAFIAQTKAILCLSPSLLQKQRRSAPRNRELCQ